ncbi:hypothetical protein D9M68_613880 [compost metagenome]
MRGRACDVLLRFSHVGPGEQASNHRGAGGGAPAGVPAVSGMPSAAHRRVEFGAGSRAGPTVQGAQIPFIVFVERGAVSNAHARTPRACAWWQGASAFDLRVRRAGSSGGLVAARVLFRFKRLPGKPQVNAPRFPLLRPDGRTASGMPPWSGRFDNALHPPIMRDLKKSGRKFLEFASCNFDVPLFLKAERQLRAPNPHPTGARRRTTARNGHVPAGGRRWMPVHFRAWPNPEPYMSAPIAAALPRSGRANARTAMPGTPWKRRWSPRRRPLPPTAMRRWPRAARCAACPKSKPAKRRASLPGWTSSIACWVAASWPAPSC